MHSGRANPQQPAPVLIGSGSQSAHGQPSATTGTYETSVVAGESCLAFVPAPLPPDPALAVGVSRQERLDEAHLALGRLDSITVLLPETSVFLYSYVRKEAVMSSQIEGTQSPCSSAAT
jgi:hypothetical protein